MLGELRDQLLDELRDQLLDELRDQLLDELRDQLLGELQDQLLDERLDQLLDEVRVCEGGTERLRQEEGGAQDPAMGGNGSDAGYRLPTSP